MLGLLGVSGWDWEPMQRKRRPQRANLGRRGRLRYLALLVALFAAAILARWLEERLSDPLSGGARVIDGDSLVVGDSEVRLEGIDAPEGPQTCRKDGLAWACGEEARRELQRLIGGGKVECRATRHDQYGRLLGRCSAAGRDLNALMVERGFAVAYGDYMAEERAAKAARRGLWASEFVAPREWRRQHGIGE